MNPKVKIALLGSNYGQRPDLNILALAQHLLAAKNYKVVISGNSTQRSEWPNQILDNVDWVNRNSVQSLLALFKANFVFYTHSLSDIFPYAHKLAILRPFLKAKLIFLQHGIIALKKTLANGKSLSAYIRSLEPTFDLMVVSSRSEAARVHSFGIDPQKLIVTGLARFDRYGLNAPIVTPRILVFFTWQDPEVLADKTSAVRNIAQRVSTAANFDFSLHPMVDKASNGFDIQQYSCLITDDSSLAWDFFYLKKQVIFFQPSQWLLDNQALRDKIANTSEKLSEYITFALKDPQSFCYDSKHFCDFRDQKNCERILQHAITIGTA